VRTKFLGHTTGTASKWRVRYAEKRLAGLDETGDRGAEPKMGTQTLIADQLQKELQQNILTRQTVRRRLL
jgi:hypothetical protein